MGTSAHSEKWEGPVSRAVRKDRKLRRGGVPGSVSIKRLEALLREGGGDAKVATNGRADGS